MGERVDVLFLLFLRTGQRESRGEDKRPGWLGVRGGAEEPPGGCVASRELLWCVVAWSIFTGGAAPEVDLPSFGFAPVSGGMSRSARRGAANWWCCRVAGARWKLGLLSRTRRWCRAAWTIRFCRQRDIFILSF